MATSFFAHTARTFGSYVPNAVYDLMTALPTGTPNVRSMVGEPLTSGQSNEVKMYQAAPVIQIDGFYSERVATTTALSGTITISHHANASVAGLNSAMRFKLSKVARGGAGTETLIGVFDWGTANPSSDSTKKTETFTLPSGFDLSVGERLILRLYAIPFNNGTYGATGNLALTVGNTSDSTNSLKVVLDNVTLTFLPNLTKFHLRRSGAAGIGSFFDMLTGRSAVAATTAAVSTGAGGAGVEIQWTQTSGGAVAEWISPRFAENWYMGTPDPATAYDAVKVLAAVEESQTTANCSWRAKVYRRRPDGTETLCLVASDPTEIGTSSAIRSVSNTTTDAVFTPMEFLEDDRLVLRLYIISAGTMGATKTCTLTYDSSAATTARLEMFETPTVKTEADPASVGTVPDGQSMSGIGN